MNIIYYIATSFANRNDYFPTIQERIDKIDGLTLACDWPRLGNEFIEMRRPASISGAEEFAAMVAIRNTEISAVIGSDLIIVALPGGNGTFFEYGLAYGIAMTTGVKPYIIVYAPNISFVKGELGHFIGLEATCVVIGDLEALAKAVEKVKSDMFARMMSADGVLV